MLCKLMVLLALTFTVISCQFTEKMTLNEDGSGRMSIEMDLSEMMAIGNEMSKDSTLTKTDTIISFKEIFEEKKESISQLSTKEQIKIKALENYNIHMVTDPETNKMVVDIFIDFKNVSEANNLMKGFEETNGIIPGMGDDNADVESSNIGVSYSYKKGIFKRDAYIIDVEKHKIQEDSMASVASFMSGMTYKIRYTFPRKIKNAKVEDATYSMDGKTIELQRSFITYLKNPDVLDLEIELEK